MSHITEKENEIVRSYIDELKKSDCPIDDYKAVRNANTLIIFYTLKRSGKIYTAEIRA